MTTIFTKINFLEKHPSIIFQDENNVVIRPHKNLRPYIANYTFCNPNSMSIQQMILPTLSTTLVYSLENNRLTDGLRGVNSKVTLIGQYAQQFRFMFLIEFHPGGLYPFLRIPQHLLLDSSFSFEELAPELNREIKNLYFSESCSSHFIDKLDRLLLTFLNDEKQNSAVTAAMQQIVTNHGCIRVSQIAAFHYSEKQLNRLFQQHIGTTLKTVSRVVRMKQLTALLNQSEKSLSQLLDQSNYYDASHFNRDFQSLYGLTPTDYQKNMSVFYNDPFKLNDYTIKK